LPAIRQLTPVTGTATWPHQSKLAHFHRVKRGCNLTSDALPFGRLWYRGPKAIRDAIGYAKFFSRSHDAVIRVYDDAGKVIGAHEQAGDFKQR